MGRVTEGREGWQYHRVAVSRASAPAHAASRRPDAAQLVVAALVVLGAAVGWADDAAPTGHGTYDAVWRAVAGGLVVACGAGAPPVAWVVSGGLAAASSAQPALMVIGAAALALATLGALRLPQVPALGGVVGLAVVAVAFHLPHTDPLGLATVVALGVAAPLVVGGWASGPLPLARFLNGLTGVVVVGSLAMAVALVFAALDAEAELEDAADRIDDAGDLLRDGDEDGARAALADGLSSLRRADASVNKAWLAPAAAVPVVGQHTDALQQIGEHGVATAQAAMDLLDVLDRDALAIDGGAVDLAAIEVLEAPTSAFAETATAAAFAIGGLDSPWLLGPLRDEIQTAAADLADLTRTARRGADAVRLAPQMLGADGPRNHLVLLVTPAELRGSGGLVGNWALVVAENGRLRLADVGRNSDISGAPAVLPFVLEEPGEYVDTYGQFGVEQAFHDITLSPDFSDVASVAAQVFETAEGVEVDTVMSVDPWAVAALLQLTGPVTVDDITLDAQTARDFLLFGQYVEFEDDTAAGEEARVAFLERLLGETFLRVLSADLSDPWNLGDVFGDVVDEGRLVLASTDPAQQALLDGLGIGGSFGPFAGEMAGVVTQNRGQNKIDTFLSRRVSYDALLDPASGRLETTVTVELVNAVTDLSLPAVVVGNNDQGYPLGTNVLELVLYSPLDLVEASVDGEVVGIRTIEEFGVLAHRRELELGPDSSTTVVFRLAGTAPLGPDGAFVLEMPVQAAVNPDQLDLSVRVTDGWTIEGRSEWQETLRTSEDQRFTLMVSGAGDG